MEDFDKEDGGTNLFGGWYGVWLSRYQGEYYSLPGNEKSGDVKKSNEVVVEDLRKYHKLGIKENTWKGIVFQFVCIGLWVFLGRSMEAMILRWSSFRWVDDDLGGRLKTLLGRPKTKSKSDQKLKEVKGMMFQQLGLLQEIRASGVGGEITISALSYNL